MIEIVPYIKEMHLPFMLELLLARNLSSSLADELPPIGYVILHESKPISMGFLRRLENAKSVLIDGLITHPNAAPELRNEANDLIVELLIATAKNMKMNQALAHTADANTLQRAKKHGFIAVPDILMSLSLPPGGDRK